MTTPAPEPIQREERLLAMLHVVSQSLSGAISVSDAIEQITNAAREFLEFERIAVLRLEGEDRACVHAAAHGVSWTPGRELKRSDFSSRLWIHPLEVRCIRDTQKELDPAYPMDREVMERGTRSILRTQLVGRSGVLGALAFGSTVPDGFSEEDERTASAIAGLVSLALEHENLLANEVRRRSRRSALHVLLPRLAEATGMEEIAEVLSSLREELLPHDLVTVAVIHGDETRLRVIGILDGSQRLQHDIDLKEMEPELEPARRTGYLRVRDVAFLDPKTYRIRLDVADPDRGIEFHVDEKRWMVWTQIGIRSQIRVLVKQAGAVVGGIVFSSRTPDFYTRDDVEMAVRIAEGISMRIAHDRITEESRRASEATARAGALESRVAALQRELTATRGTYAAVGASKSWQDALAHATQVAGADTTVLLTGESGTGKEVIARFVHHASARANGPFVAINCAALPEQLLEAELFGHEKGAFTGAAAARAGRIEQAAGGVLFLDEVGEMSPVVQAKFLRVLQEREFQRLGGSRTLKADIRLIAATNRDLRQAIQRGLFREDLYYRLHVFAIHLPPLRDRPDDILVLTEHFLKDLGTALGRGAAGVTPPARDALQRYAWPGNARELRNVIERALILCDGGLIQPHHLAFGAAPEKDGAGGGSSLLEDGPLPERGVDLEALERSLVKRALAQSSGNKSKAAKLLNLTRAQLYSRIEKYGL